MEAGHVHTLWPLSPAAYCKNSIDGQWYCFDDSEVSPVGDEDVCQQTAYILFYQRRTAVPSWSANSSVAGQSPPTPRRAKASGLLAGCLCLCLLQVPPVRLCVTTGSTGCQAAELPAWPREPPPGARLWPRWQNRWSSRQNAAKTTVRLSFFFLLLVLD